MAKAAQTLEQHFPDISGVVIIAEILANLTPELYAFWRFNRTSLISYRYLKNNPSLRYGMAQMEAELQTHAFRYIPKESVGAIESKLQSGDIIDIVTHKPHVYCSHVGLAMRTQYGVC